MTLYLSFFFILSFNVIIFNFPSSRGYNTGYHVSTLNQVLTPSERLTYSLSGILPSRIYYSNSNNCYMVKEQKKENEEGYKAIPRWEYYLQKLSPADILKIAKDMLFLPNDLLGLGGKDYGDFGGFDNDVDLENPDYDSESDTDGSSNDGKNNEEGSGMLPNDIFSRLSNYVMGGSNDKEKSNESKDNKNDDNSDKKHDKKDDDSTSITQMAQDALESDVAKDVAKDIILTGIQFLVPGGPAIVGAINKYEDSQKKVDAVENLIDKVPKIK